MSCILNPWGRFGDCDDAIQNSTDTIYSTEMWNNWLNMTTSINHRLQYASQAEDARHTALYQTAYPPFFETWTEQCNKARFLPPYFPYAGPLITIEVRDRLNLFGQELNAALAFWIDELNYSLDAGKSAESVSFMKFANQDERYNGHRFCREGVIEPDRDNNQTWFFNLFSSSDPDGNSSTHQGQPVDRNAVSPATCDSLLVAHDADALSCVLRNATANDPSINGTLWPSDSEYIQKTFHPHHAGYKATSEELQQRLRYDVNDTAALGSGSLRIMCIGDSLAIGIGEDAREESYRRALHSLLTRSNERVEFVGTQVRPLEALCCFYGRLMTMTTGKRKCAIEPH